MDKPDTRFGLELREVTDLAKQDDSVPLFASAVAEGGIVKGLKLPAGGGLSRAELDGLEEVAKSFGARGLARAKVGAEGQWVQSPLAKSISPALRAGINQRLEAAEGDVLLFQFGRPRVVQRRARAACGSSSARELHLIPEGRDDLLWIVDFPLFEYSEENKAYVASHHPFTSPRAEDVELLLSDPGRVKAVAYDLVLNGNEIGGGSIRIHDSGVQAKVFQTLGISDAEAQSKFGYLLEALKFGAPPRRAGAGDGPAGDAARRGGVAARRDSVSQDAEGHRSDDWGPGGCHRGAAAGAARAEHGRVAHARWGCATAQRWGAGRWKGSHGRA